MSLLLPTDRPFFVRIYGRYGVHELRAVIDTASELCLMQKKDALELGYHPFYSTGWANAGTGTNALTPYNVIEMPTFTLDKVEIGRMVWENVPTSAIDFIENLGVDVILGRSFLKGFEARFDFTKGTVALERKAGGGSS
jgi:predicted aspartyl protease